MCIANQQPLLSKYNFINWAAVSKCVDHLPEASREESRLLVAEGYLVAKTSFSLALDVAGSLARVMDSLVNMRRAPWL